jgi:hypothetical protein
MLQGLDPQSTAGNVTIGASWDTFLISRGQIENAGVSLFGEVPQRKSEEKTRDSIVNSGELIPS